MRTRHGIKGKCEDTTDDAGKVAQNVCLVLGCHCLDSMTCHTEV